MSWNNLLGFTEAHQGMAAWVQAVFSVLAIVFAAFVPWLHELSRERRSVKQAKKMLAFLSHRQGELWLCMYVPLYKAIEDFGVELEHYVNSGNGSEWPAHRTALDSVPLVGLSAKELNNLIFLRTSADYALNLYPLLWDWNAMDNGSRRSLRMVKIYMDSANKIYKDLGIISDQEL